MALLCLIDEGVIVATLADGGIASAPIGAGLYALPLPSGAYTVCVDGGLSGGTCTQVGVTGAPVRVDVRYSETPEATSGRSAPRESRLAR